MNLILTLLLMAHSSYAQDQAASKSALAAEDFCEHGHYGQIRSVKTSVIPNYFIRALEKDGKTYVAYAGNEPNARQNVYLMDLETSKVQGFYGMVDPVPLSRDVMSVPVRMPEAFGLDGGFEMIYYKTDDILKGKQSPEFVNIENNEALNGAYQSVGELRKDADGTIVKRMITDKNGVTAADFTIDAAGKIKMSRKPQRICPGIDMKLPMLSKDGSMISGYDYEKKSSKIWRILDSGKCEEMLDLKILIGKADFSYDNKKIAFHTYANDSYGYFDEPRDRNLNVYVYDFEKKSLTQMTRNRAQHNSYYPVFKEDGSIIYTDASPYFNFVEADPKKARSVNYDLSKGSSSDKNIEDARYLGALWMKKCSQFDGKGSDSFALIPQSLDSEKCKALVEDQWRVQIADYAKPSKEKLLAACPKQRGSNLTQTDPGEEIHLSAAEKIITTQCSVCHSNLSAMALRKPGLDKSFAAKILSRIHAEGEQRMPRGGSLDSKEIKAIEDYVKTL